MLLPFHRQGPGGWGPAKVTLPRRGGCSAPGHPALSSRQSGSRPSGGAATLPPPSPTASDPQVPGSRREAQAVAALSPDPPTPRPLFPPDSPRRTRSRARPGRWRPAPVGPASSAGGGRIREGVPGGSGASLPPRAPQGAPPPPRETAETPPAAAATPVT